MLALCSPPVNRPPAQWPDSAGRYPDECRSHTEPGYTGAGSDKLHKTERGKMIALTEQSSEWNTAYRPVDIADERSPEIIAQQIISLGYEPVWKDWDAALTP